MCLIIQREANAPIDEEKFHTAVKNNPNGWGVAWPEDNKLEVFKTPQKWKAEEIFRFVQEDLIDVPVTVHLRYTTVGKTNRRNAHPFPILSRKRDGLDLVMCHNGTIHTFKSRANKDESDTRAFVRLMVRPLFQRLVRGMDVQDILTDPCVHDILSYLIPSTSVLTFMDSEGTTMQVNHDGNGGGFDEYGVYYSNVYSFKNNYRSPADIKPTSYFKDTVYENGRWVPKNNKITSLYQNNTGVVEEVKEKEEERLSTYDIWDYYEYKELENMKKLYDKSSKDEFCEFMTRLVKIGFILENPYSKSGVL